MRIFRRNLAESGEGIRRVLARPRGIRGIPGGIRPPKAYIGHCATATKGVRQPASARTPTSDVAVMSSSQSERAVKTLSEPGLPGLGARALCMTVVPVMDQLDRLDRCLEVMVRDINTAVDFFGRR